jgi:hypothetical protein
MNEGTKQLSSTTVPLGSENLTGPMTMSQVELRILSIGLGAATRWALYAVPCADEEEAERVECYSLDELDILLTKLKRTGVNDSVLIAARNQVGERIASYMLGAYELSQDDRDELQLEPVTGLTRSELDDLTFGEA